MFVRPAKGVELFANILHHLIAQELGQFGKKIVGNYGVVHVKWKEGMKNWRFSTNIENDTRYSWNFNGR